MPIIDLFGDFFCLGKLDERKQESKEKRGERDKRAAYGGKNFVRAHFKKRIRSDNHARKVEKQHYKSVKKRGKRGKNDERKRKLSPFERNKGNKSEQRANKV